MYFSFIALHNFRFHLNTLICILEKGRGLLSKLILKPLLNDLILILSPVLNAVQVFNMLHIQKSFFGPFLHGLSRGVGLFPVRLCSKNCPVPSDWQKFISSQSEDSNMSVFLKLKLQQNRSFCWRSLGHSKGCVSSLNFFNVTCFQFVVKSGYQERLEESMHCDSAQPSLVL